VWFGRPLGLDRTLACAVGVVACAVVPQMMGRTDTTHAIYGVAPAIILIWALGEGAAGRSPRMAAPLLLVVTATALILPVRHVPALRLDTGPTRPTLQNPRGAGTVGFQNRDELAQAIQSLSAPGERIYVGLTDHRRIFISEMDLYFLADRPGATRYMQFDPNMQNRADVQQEMIRELEQHRTRLAVLSAHFTHHVEPNEVQRMGADQLDQYFRANFERKQQIGEYSLMLRKEE
jgi:hypothetical protein